MNVAKTEPLHMIETSPPDAQGVRLATIMAELAAQDGVQLPADVQALFRRLAGSCKTSFEFDPETYFEGKQGVYDW